MRFLRTCVLGVLAAAGIAAAGGPNQPGVSRGLRLLEADPTLLYDPTSVLVRFKEDTPAQVRDGVLALLGGTVRQRFTIVPRLEHIDLATMHADDALAVLNQMDFIEYAEPDYFVRHVPPPVQVVSPPPFGVDITPNDPLFGQQWGWGKINAPAGWDAFRNAPTFVVADIDTGVQFSHPDLSANIWVNPGEIAGNGIDDDGNGFIDDINGWDFFSNDNNPDDSDGHGTHTSGTVGAVTNNGVGVAGTMWQCKIMCLRFLGPSGGSTTGAINCLQYARNKGVKVSNNSWGSYGFSSSLQSAIQQSQSIGHIFVAAAGNDNNNNDGTSKFYPASYTLDNIIAVASTTSTDARSSFSNYGLTSVDLGAPGSGIVSTYRGSQYASISGTSMASPHVAGAVGLVYAQNPGFTYQQVRARILSTVRPIASLNGITVTGGILNLQGALGPPVNQPPTVTITSPANNSVFSPGTNITFQGSASDPEQGNIGLSIVWTSNLQGAIGNGPFFQRSDLVVGTHTITASITDNGGLQDTDQIQVTIQSAVPAAPTNLTATNLGGGQAQLTWTDNSSNENGFKIQRQQRVGTSWVNNGIIVTTGPNVTSYIDTPGAGLWRYRIKSFNSAGASANTTWKKVTVN